MINLAGNKLIIKSKIMKKEKTTTKTKAVIKEKIPEVVEKVVERVIVKYVFKDGKMVVVSWNMTHVLWYSKIIGIKINELLSNTLRIHYVGRKDIIVKLPLKWFEERLSERDFIKTHVSCIANMIHTEFLEKLDDKGFLYLTGDNKLR